MQGKLPLPNMVSHKRVRVKVETSYILTQSCKGYHHLNAIMLVGRKKNWEINNHSPHISMNVVCWVLLKLSPYILTIMLLLANLVNTKRCKKPEKWLKPWHMGTHLIVLIVSCPMNTNTTGFRWFSKIVGVLCFGRIKKCLGPLGITTEVRHLWAT